ncbi:MAG: universal stress protein [Acidobacteriota bacterium]
MSERMKILLAYDGSACADHAIEDMQRAGLPAEADALVVAVEEVWLPAPPMSSYEIVEKMVLPEGQVATQMAPVAGFRAEDSEAYKLAEEAQRKIQRLFPAWQVTIKCAIGSPATEVLRIADEWKPDLIVVGSHGRTALGRFFFGSVSHKIVTEAHATVRVSRCAETNGVEKEKLLIAVDGSMNAETAIQTVAHRQFPAETEARVVIVTDPLKPSLVGAFIPRVSEWVDESNKDERNWARDTARQQAEILNRAGFLASYAVREGDPRRELIREAEDWNATTIFVGARGLNTVDRFLLGSVSAAIAQRAECTVEIVRPKT